MITIIHGSNQVLTRNELQNLKAKYKEVSEISGKDLSLNDFQLSVNSQSLFVEERLVVIENFFSGKKKRDEIINYLTKNVLKVDLTFWEAKESKSKDINLLSAIGAKVLNYNIPVIIFKFLDSFFPENAKNCLLLFADCLLTNEPEMIFFMLVKQIRYLLLAQSENNNIKPTEFPSDYSGLAPWQKGKLYKQAQLWTLEKLSKLYEELITTDFNLKTGQTNLNIEEQLRLFLLQNL